MRRTRRKVGRRENGGEGRKEGRGDGGVRGRNRGREVSHGGRRRRRT